MTIRNVPLDSQTEQKHRLLLAQATNELIRFSQPNELTEAEVGAGITPIDFRYPPGDIRRYGATGDGSTDDTAAIQAAINSGARVRIPEISIGTTVYKVTSTLTISSNFQIVEWDNTACFVKKFFNGPVFTVTGGEVEFVRPGIDGNGATYTGAGISLPSGANGFRMYSPRIFDTAAAPITIGSDAGSLMKVFGGLMQPYNASASGSVHMVAMTAADTTGANRKFIGCSSGGAPLFDATGAETVLLDGCDGSYVTYSGTSKKIQVIGCRLQTAGNTMTVNGTDHVVVGNSIAGSVVLASGTNTSVVRANGFASGYSTTDSSATNTNDVETWSVTYTPAWTASGTAPAIGNGTLTGYFYRRGRELHVQITFVAGSTTTFGTGTYRFSLPAVAAAGRQYHGAAYLLDSGTGHYAAISKCVAGEDTVSVFSGNATATSVGATAPFTFANGDQIIIDLCYEHVV